MIGGDFDGGLYMYLNKLNENGYAKIKEIEYPHYYPFTEKMLWNFDIPSYTNLDIEYIKSEKFDEINCIYIDNYNDSNEVLETIQVIKSEIVLEKPIIFGMSLHESFTYYDDFWTDTIQVKCQATITDEDGNDVCCCKLNTNPSGYCDGYEPDSYWRGHAMTLIGYDDSKYGGAFLIQNSWGKNKHNEGRIWIPYNVFVKYAYDIQSLDKNQKLCLMK